MLDTLKRTFNNLFDLSLDAASPEIIYDRVALGAEVKVYAVLILAIFIASAGFNSNSMAVFIGAMLISPLMGGIIAIAYGLATFDGEIAKTAFVKLLFRLL